jgi:hypothetical protein
MKIINWLIQMRLAALEASVKTINQWRKQMSVEWDAMKAAISDDVNELHVAATDLAAMAAKVAAGEVDPAEMVAQTKILTDATAALKQATDAAIPPTQ